jgi:hypothetical protein
MQTAVSIIALVLSVVSITWHVATFALAGGRVKVELRVGAYHESGSGLISAAPGDMAQAWGEHERAQGYTRPVVLVRVRPIGRMPVTVESWSLVAQRVPESVPGRVEIQLGRGELMTLQPVAGSIGPPLPHRLEPGGASETWAIDAADVIQHAEAAKAAFKVSAVAIVGRVELGNGRTYTTGEILRL